MCTIAQLKRDSEPSAFSFSHPVEPDACACGTVIFRDGGILLDTEAVTSQWVEARLNAIRFRSTLALRFCKSYDGRFLDMGHAVKAGKRWGESVKQIREFGFHYGMGNNTELEILRTPDASDFSLQF